MPGDSGVTVVTNACAFLSTIAHAAIGRIGRPAFPAPSDVLRAGILLQTSGASRGENAKLYLNLAPLAGRGRREAPGEGEFSASPEPVESSPHPLRKMLATSPRKRGEVKNRLFEN